MNNEIIKFSKWVIEKCGNLDDLIDEKIEPITDFTDTLGNLVAPVKLIKSIYESSRARKFEGFIKAFAYQIQNHKTKGDDLNKMAKYLENQKNSNFIHDLIDSAIKSHSIFGSMILGYYAGHILIDELVITPKEIIKLESIRSLNDFELACLVRIYDKVSLADEVNIADYQELKGLGYFAELTIQKLIQLRVVDEPKDTPGSSKQGRFVSGELAEEIFQMIVDMKLKSTLLDYKF